MNRGRFKAIPVQYIRQALGLFDCIYKDHNFVANIVWCEFWGIQKLN